MIGRPVLETAHRPDAGVLAPGTEQEQTEVEDMRTEIGEHAQAGVAPRRGAHVAGGAVSIEDPEQVDSAKSVRFKKLLQVHNVRLEAVVIGGVGGHTLSLGQA